MNENVFIPTESKFENILERTVDKLLERRIPAIMRRADRKEFLTTKEFKELFGISYRLQKHYRDELGLPYFQEGKKIIYKTVEVENWFSERKVNAKAEQ